MEGQFRDVSDLARQAIAQLRATDPRNVRASRRGLCAAVVIEKRTFIFRRCTDGLVRLEAWTNRNGNAKVTTYRLPNALEREAGELLDR